MAEEKREFLVDNHESIQAIVELMFSTIPHTQALGLEVVSFERNKAIGRLPYQNKFVGNIENGALHTGVLLSLIDTIAGLAVICALPEMEEIATLDLRLDSFKPSTPDQDIYATAECYRLTKTVAFVRGSIYHDNPENQIAGCVASFFRSRNRASVRSPIGQWQ